MTWDEMPTLQEIRQQRLLTPVQLAELEMWFQASSLAGEALALSPSLSQALNRLVMLSEMPVTATAH